MRAGKIDKCCFSKFKGGTMGQGPVKTAVIVFHHILKRHVTEGKAVANGKKHGVINKVNERFISVEDNINEGGIIEGVEKHR